MPNNVLFAPKLKAFAPHAMEPQRAAFAREQANEQQSQPNYPTNKCPQLPIPKYAPIAKDRPNARCVMRLANAGHVMELAPLNRGIFTQLINTKRVIKKGSLYE